MPEHLNIYAVGDFGPPDEQNPRWLTGHLNGWPLLEALSRAPSTAEALAEGGALPASDVTAKLGALAGLGLVRLEGGRYHLGFAWFSAADQELINSAVQPVAAELAEVLLGRRTELDAQIDRLTARRWCEPRDLRFALIGCFGLDWGGLEALKASGHLVHDKEQPGGRRYILYVEERVDRFSERDYTGSHSTRLGDQYTWTSFGDHGGRRYALPDYLFHLQAAVVRDESLPAEQRRALSLLVLQALHAQLGAAADAMISGLRGDKREGLGWQLLEAVGAVRIEWQGAPSIPVFHRVWDGAAMDRIVSTVQECLLQVVHRRYGYLRDRLHSITPLRHGVAFGECFNPIWHTLFGHTNRMLAEGGYLADPTPSHPGEGRYRWWLTVECETTYIEVDV